MSPPDGVDVLVRFRAWTGASSEMLRSKAMLGPLDRGCFAIPERMLVLDAEGLVCVAVVDLARFAVIANCATAGA